MNITEQMIDALRSDIEKKMSPKRFRHTSEVEKMAAYLGSLYVPESIPLLRVASLLHDITKEYSSGLQLKICTEKDIPLEKEDLFAPKTLHARTAAALIPDIYPQFADEKVISCVRWHTTGRANMTLEERLIYLADYIDMSRTFEDCVRLREYFMVVKPENLDMMERISHLRRTLILSFDMTLKALLDEGLPVNRDTLNARNSLVCEELEGHK